MRMQNSGNQDYFKGSFAGMRGRMVRERSDFIEIAFAPSRGHRLALCFSADAAITPGHG
jgi:hypothetical protein